LFNRSRVHKKDDGISIIVGNIDPDAPTVWEEAEIRKETTGESTNATSATTKVGEGVSESASEKMDKFSKITKGPNVLTDGWGEDYEEDNMFDGC